MGQFFSELHDKHINFIREQKIFFVGTATADSTVNVSPKGMDSLRVFTANRIVWLNVTGSGNETAAHVQQSPRITIMFCAFEGAPMILRVYGQARAIHRSDADWESLFALFPPLPGSRQIFDVSIERVQTSCGMAVPFFNYSGEREQLSDWAKQKGDGGIRSYWETKNQHSIDGIPTDIIAKNTET